MQNVIDRCVVNTQDYWDAIAKLGEMIITEDEKQEQEPMFTEDDMVKYYG